MMLLARAVLRSRLRCPPLSAAAASTAAFSSAPSPAAAEAERAVRDGPRNDWSRPEIQAVYDSPLLDLLFHGVPIPISPLSFFFFVLSVYVCSLDW
jgi:biotin synthase